MDFHKNVPKTYYNEATKKGSIEEISYDSFIYATTHESVTKKALVYLPYGYDEKASKEYKVLYLMHGGGGSEVEFLYGQDNSHALVNILDNMMANGDLEPMIVVTPSFYYSDSQSALHDIKEAGILTKYYHNEFRNDLVPYVEEKYHISKKREDRAFGGFSMGGETTWEVFLNCLDLVKNYIPLSGDCWIIEQKGGATFPKETARAMLDTLSENRLLGYDYNIFAFTGDLDIAFPALDAQIKAMREAGFGTGENRLRYESWSEGTHCYQFIYEYLYNALPVLF